MALVSISELTALTGEAREHLQVVNAGEILQRLAGAKVQQLWNQ